MQMAERETLAQVDDAFRSIMAAKSVEISFAHAVKNLKDAAARVVDLVARTEVRKAFEGNGIRDIERLAQNILSDAALLKAHHDAKQ